MATVFLFFLFIYKKKKTTATAQTWLEMDGLGAASVSIVTHHVLFGSAQDTVKGEKLEIALAGSGSCLVASAADRPQRTSVNQRPE